MSKVCNSCGEVNDDIAVFCGSCGHKFEEAAISLEPETKVCSSCGAENPVNAGFCAECGSPFEQESQFVISEQEVSHEEPASITDWTELEEEPVTLVNPAKPALDLIKDRINETITPERIDQAKVTAGKVASFAKNAASTALTKAKETKEAIDQKNAEEIRRRAHVPEPRDIPKKGTIQLWSSLNKEMNRRQFYIDSPEKDFSRDIFIASISEKLETNQVNAVVERKDVQWDRGNTSIETYCITPQTSAVNPFVYILQYNKVGKFTYVENRVFITPPDLPQIPGEILPFDSAEYARTSTMMMIFGVLAVILLISVVGIMAGIILGIMAVYYFLKHSQLKQIKEHNEKVAEAIRKWDEEWNNWYRKNFINEIQETIDGSLSRIFDSINACVDQVDDDLFNQKPVVEKENLDMNELTALIQRNKDEYR